MNKTDVIKQISERSGIMCVSCEVIVNAFEEESGDVLALKMKGIKREHSEVLRGVSEQSGYSEEDCEKVLLALDEVLDTALSNKLRFFKKK